MNVAKKHIAQQAVHKLCVAKQLALPTALNVVQTLPQRATRPHLLQIVLRLADIVKMAVAMQKHVLQVNIVQD
jgi:hypothetical protein